jgi:hypothetical protein
MAAAAIVKIPCAARVTNSSTAATLECTTQAKPAPSMLW